ncbi:MAG: hypothetical protein Q4G35_11230 [Propionibacteriaceae bacterium]|nr:hypothetical protein [Propionibacteriaceae bacterium]
MDHTASYKAGTVTVVTIDEVGSLGCLPSTDSEWANARAVAPQLPLDQHDNATAASPAHMLSPARPAPGREAPIGLQGPSGIDALFGQSFAQQVNITTMALPDVTVATANTKGGAAKTTIAILVALAAADMAGHNDIALVDINPSGNLGEHTHRSAPGTIIDLAKAAAQPEFGRSPRDLTPFINWQPGGWMTVTCPVSIVSNDGGLLTDLSEDDIATIHTALKHSCQMLVFDTGNNGKDPAWQAAIQRAHRILVPLQWDPDTLVEAQKMITDMQALGHADLKQRIIFVGTYGPGQKPDRKREKQYRQALTNSGWNVMDIPPDRHIASKGIVEWGLLNPKTRTAALALVRAIVS